VESVYSHYGHLSEVKSLRLQKKQGHISKQLAIPGI
jgi:hypothetical protein